MAEDMSWHQIPQSTTSIPLIPAKLQPFRDKSARIQRRHIQASRTLRQTYFFSP